MLRSFSHLLRRTISPASRNYFRPQLEPLEDPGRLLDWSIGDRSREMTGTRRPIGALVRCLELMTTSGSAAVQPQTNR